MGAAPRGQPLRGAALRRALPRAATASWWSRRRTRASWCARGAHGSRRSSTTRTRCSPSTGCAQLVAVGQSLPFRRGGSVALPLDVSRTLEDLLERAEFDFVHVHEPFAPSAASAALRHSRALNVGTLPRRHRAGRSRPRWRAGWWSCCSAASTGAPRASPPRATWWSATSPGDYRVIRPGADLRRPPATRTDGGSSRDRVLGRGGARRAAALPARAAAAADGPDWRATVWLRDPRDRARRVSLPRRLRDRVRFAGPGRRLGGAAPGARRRSPWPRRRARRPAPQLVLRALAGGAVPVASRLPQYEEALDDGELGLLFEPRDAVTLAAQLERLISDPALRDELAGAASSARTRARVVARGRPLRGALRARSPARRHPRTATPEVRKRLAERELHPRGPAHAHRPLARLRDPRRHAARHRQGARPRARSR